MNGQTTSESAWTTLQSFVRFHHLLLVGAASLTFSWVLNGYHQYGIAAICILDWFLFNFLGRIADRSQSLDLAEDYVEKHAKALTAMGFLLTAIGIGLVYTILPELLPSQLVFHATSLVYHYRVIPSLKGLKRLRELYFFKNVVPGLLFVWSGFIYPLVAAGTFFFIHRPKLLFVVLFFLLLDLTYEILGDLRDLPGDQEQGLQTFPVVHGPLAAQHLVLALWFLAGLTLTIGYAVNSLAFKEWIFVAAILFQLAFYHGWVVKGLSRRDVILHAYVNAILLFAYNGWIWAGLPLEAPRLL